MVNVNDFVATPAGLGRVDIVHPRVLGPGGNAPNVKVVYNVYGTKQVVTRWYREDQIKKQV